jgi:hypothetical protein
MAKNLKVLNICRDWGFSKEGNRNLSLVYTRDCAVQLRSLCVYLPKTHRPIILHSVAKMFYDRNLRS